ncbi:hypothetical protein [Roseivirga pacifica]|uniref:hypothetical protein n=1 Tax=Roseivirga pacifica TaxID=1267423 RepID=UPI003BA9FEA3
MSVNLSGKKVLFFSVKTFNLEIEIKKKMEQAGAQVTYFDERPANNNFTKGIIRLRRSLYERTITRYYEHILKSLKQEKFDYLFVNRGEVIPAFFLEQFRKDNPHCEFIFHTWDSFSNHVYPLSILKYFDRKFSFDPSDCLEHGLNFRPLFYLDDFATVADDVAGENEQYKMLFLGTAHSDRYMVSTNVANWFHQAGYETFCYYFMHGRIVYFYKVLFDREFQKFDWKKLSFKSLTKKEIIDLYRRSDIILDINHPGQAGLTMRTLEAIGANKKLITTNKNIARYPFYNSNNVFILDREQLNLNEDFLQTPYLLMEETVKESLSIGGWLKDIFDHDEAAFWPGYLAEHYTRV